MTCIVGGVTCEFGRVWPDVKHIAIVAVYQSGFKRNSPMFILALRQHLSGKTRASNQGRARKMGGNVGFHFLIWKGKWTQSFIKLFFFLSQFFKAIDDYGVPVIKIIEHGRRRYFDIEK